MENYLYLVAISTIFVTLILFLQTWWTEHKRKQQTPVLYQQLEAEYESLQLIELNELQAWLNITVEEKHSINKRIQATQQLESLMQNEPSILTIEKLKAQIILTNLYATNEDKARANKQLEIIQNLENNALDLQTLKNLQNLNQNTPQNA